MSTDIRAELEYMAQHVTPDEFRVAALAEVGRMQTELERLHSCLRYETESHVAERGRLRAELEQLREVKQRVRDEIDAVVAGTISPAVAVTNIVRALDEEQS